MPFLGSLESELMDIFWSGHAGNTAGIHSMLSLSRSVAKSTVESTLHRLVAKGFVEREKQAGAWFYTARLSRDAFRHVLRRMGAGG